MSLDPSDTIVAIASAPGGAARGIVRASGPDAVAIARQWFRAAAPPCLDSPSRAAVAGLGESGYDPASLDDLRHPTAVEGALVLPALHSPLPATLYVWPTARSYTRQPVVEVHTLGSPPLLQRVLQSFCDAGARPAEPGEFTLRAFLAGRLDLTQAEAVLGLIDARGDREFDLALSQLAGGLAAPLSRLRETLLDLLAHLEAGLDFVEDDIEFIAAGDLQRGLRDAAETVERLVKQMESRLETADAIRVVLTGCPNVGKSSLFNALVGKDRALVSPSAGTTRDYLLAELVLDGVRCQLLDTAGVEQVSSDGIAALAEEQRARQAAAAHIELFCIDATRRLNAWEQARLAEPAAAPRLVILTKFDQAPEQSLALVSGPACGARLAAHAPSKLTPLTSAVPTSSLTGVGIGELKAAIAAHVASVERQESSGVAGTALRCRESLRLSLESLERALELVAGGGGHELIAAEVRSALTELGKVVGAVYTDDVLDRIFSRFCIGK